MKKVTKIVIGTVASLGLLIGAGAYAGKNYMKGMKGDFMIYKLEKELDLSTEQVDRLKDIQSYAKAKHESHDHKAGKAKMMEMLKSPTLDQAQVMSMIDEKMQTMRDSAPEMIGKIAGFTDSLSDTQRAEMMEMIEQFSSRMGRHRGHH